MSRRIFTQVTLDGLHYPDSHNLRESQFSGLRSLKRAMLLGSLLTNLSYKSQVESYNIMDNNKFFSYSIKLIMPLMNFENYNSYVRAAVNEGSKCGR